ncbi:DEAD/DEAH box helicase [Glutamicibacter mishrai]|uniref:DEAD/DEAH box helicase n=1 Tax=Glutamicibacter mishrai TaxID=1775880 RepID=UPI0020CE60B8|nr:DEAD/DEAH box helicase [Glutamicibacter mishrai]UTT39436.1 DEAD/DEAH box helicase [Glutamicibacter mishrai]
MNSEHAENSNAQQDLHTLSVVNGELVQLSDDRVVRPPADRILALYRESPSEFLENTTVKVSAKTLEVFVRITGLLPDNLKISLAAKKGQLVIDLPTAETVGIVIGARWYAAEPGSLEQSLSVLKSINIPVGNTFSFGDYLDITSRAIAQSRVIDETSVSAPNTLSSDAIDFKALGLVLDLYPYQQVGAEFMVAMADRGIGTLLADQMGLGKTAQAIALILSQIHLGKTLIICPASLSTNWIRELAQFAPTISACIHAGPVRTGIIEGFAAFDVVITSYETLVSDIGFMSDYDWRLVILDEAQSIRNPNTQRAICAKRLSRHISVAITGTPVENTLLDAWSISEFVLPILLGRKEEFRESFPDELDGARALGNILAPVLIRRLVSDVAQDLPSLIQHPVALELNSALQVKYADIIDDAHSLFAATTALRILCAHSKEEYFSYEYSKIERCTNIISEIISNKEKVLVFASFQEVLDSLFTLYSSTFPEVFIGVIDGRVSPTDRQEAIDSFQGFIGSGILLMNPQAAGVGLNITAANHVIHFNPEWNPALTAQATARAYRRKQELPVSAHHLFYINSIEEDAINRAEWKRALADSLDDGSQEE